MKHGDVRRRSTVGAKLTASGHSSPPFSLRRGRTRRAQSRFVSHSPPSVSSFFFSFPPFSPLPSLQFSRLARIGNSDLIPPGRRISRKHLNRIDLGSSSPESFPPRRFWGLVVEGHFLHPANPEPWCNHSPPHRHIVDSCQSRLGFFFLFINPRGSAFGCGIPLVCLFLLACQLLLMAP